MSVTYTRVRMSAGLAARIILSAAAMVFFASMLHFLPSRHGAERLQRGAPDVFASLATGLGGQNTARGNMPAFWPCFPGSDNAPLHQIVINGVTFLSQDWRSSAPAKEVIAYYKEQMTARGWQDATRETFELRPESQLPAAPAQNYLAQYDRIIESSLVLKLGGWSLWVTVAPREKGLWTSDVRILAASTSSLKEFGLSLEAALLPGSGSGQPVDTTQESNGQRCHTVFSVKQSQPADAFQAAMAELQEQGWKLTLRQGRSQHFAWLTKGQQCACLVVRAAHKGIGSEVMLTELAPE